MNQTLTINPISEQQAKTFSSDLDEKGFCQVRNLLINAKSLESNILNQSEWNYCFNKSGIHTDISYTEYQKWSQQQKDTLKKYIQETATDGFQYSYKSIPIYDLVKNRAPTPSYFGDIYSLVNSPEFLQLARTITNNDKIAFADCQITRFDSGDFLSPHDDKVEGKNRVAAYVLNLTSHWQRFWGGNLEIEASQNSTIHCLTPEFNTLNIFNIPQKHWVSYVNPIASASRISITGWLREHSE